MRGLAVLASSIGLLPLIGKLTYFVDGYLQTSLPLTPIYLLPIILTGWFCGRLPGLGVCAVSSLTLHLATSEGSAGPVAHQIMISLQSMTYLMITFLVTNLRATIESEKLLSRTDALTGLLNPRAFYEAGRAELSRSLRHNRIMTCLGVDVDNFKLINDKLGHATGDHALKLIGDSFRKSLRASDLAARVGGDEFCILLPETDGEGAKVVIDRIRQQISVASFGKLFISVGCVTFKIIPESVDVMLRETDLAMYTAKGKGGGQVAYVDLTQFSTPPEIISSNQMRSVSAKESS